MSYIPIRNAKTLKSSEEKSFFGLNRSERAALGEFCDMENLSSQEYPYLSTRLPRGLSEVYNSIFETVNDVLVKKQISNVRAVIAPREDSIPKGFCGVIGTEFYYNGKAKAMRKPAVYDSNGKYKYGMEIAEDGKIQLLWANRIIIIHGYDCESRKPYIYYYDTDDEGTSSDYIKSYEYKDGVDYTQRSMDMLADGTGRIHFQYKAPSSFKGGYWDFKAGDSVFIDGVMTYADSRWKEYSKSNITSAVVISYSESQTGSGAGYVYWDIDLKLRFYNYKGEQPFDYAYTASVEHIYKKIPYMTHLAMHKGRLWGANPNGEYVYGSALGELFDFNRFDGLSDDSVFLESSSQGGYLGVISCKDTLITLKKNELEAIYGELPNEFAVGKSYPGYGCCDISSCVVIDSALYFLGWQGFYAWNGSKPYLISEKLEKNYSSAYAFTDGIKYFVSAGYDNAQTENLVFDTRYGLWHKEDNSAINGFFRRDNQCFILTSDKIYEIDAEGEKFEWHADSIKYFYDEFELSRINEIWMRIKLDKNSEIEVYTSTDGGEWRRCTSISSKDISGEYKIVRIPVRLEEGIFWQYRLKGRGKCIILGLKMLRDKGGRIYSNERIDER